MSHRTFRTRVTVSVSSEPLLSAYAELFNRVGRTLHARIEQATSATGVSASAGSFKNGALKEFGLTGRQFNAIAVSVDGKRKAIVACNKRHIETMANQVQRLVRTLAELKDSLVSGRFNKARTKRTLLTAKGRSRALVTIHHRSRSLVMWQRRLATKQAQVDSNKLSVCFGSRALFQKQFSIEANGYASHAHWLEDWQASRNDQFMVLGSKDEAGGCSGCVASLAQDGSVSVRVQLPLALRGQASHVDIHGLQFAYGHAQVAAAIKEAARRKLNERQARLDAKASDEKFSGRNVEGGSALTWRFMRDTNGWEVFVSVAASPRPTVSVQAAGRVAVDINAGFLAVAETDCFGNCVAAFSVPCRTQGLSTHRTAAVMGDAVKAVMAHVSLVRKPLVLEKLDFSTKKRGLKLENPDYARMLSAFAYNGIKTLFEARAFDRGIEVYFVNPAYTSVIGRVKYSVPLGITTHEGAAVAIARRSQGVRERAPQPGKVLFVPVKGSVTAWTSPDWMKPQHRAYPWRRIARELPRLYQREPARSTSAAKVLVAARKRCAALAGEAVSPPAQA